MKILVLNGGSSSFKCWFSDITTDAATGPAPVPQWEAHVEWDRDAQRAHAKVRSSKAALECDLTTDSPLAALEPILTMLWQGEAAAISTPSEIDAVGHRIVHGGKAFRGTTRLTPEVCDAIAQQVEFAPSHNRFELEAVRITERMLGAHVPQIAVFDTGFHETLPPPAYVYPGPYEWLDEGIRRFGFHGISHRYASRRAAEILARPLAGLRIIVCHLGNGASLCAVRDGRSIDTTMGFTPLDGLMMGSRSGSVDPGILIYLLRHRGYQADDLDRILNQESGLSGISGVSSDMREILKAINAGNDRARLAFDIYAHRVAQAMGAMMASLGGLDAVVFTGGVGENCPRLRERACAQFEFIGLRLSRDRNYASPRDEDIAAAGSKIRVLVVRAEEDWEIARECRRLMRT